MKKPGKLLTNTTLAICGSSLILNSCDGYFYNGDMINEDQLSDIGLSAINIELSPEDQAYIEFLNKLGLDIIQNPKIAEEFAKDPQVFVEKYGYHAKVDLDKNMLHYILTLGDQDINIAIHQNDFKKVIKLMRKKELLVNNYTKVELTHEQIKQIHSFLGITKVESRTEKPPQTIIAVATAIVWVFVAAIEDAVAGYNVGFGVNVWAWANVKSKVNAWGATSQSTSQNIENMALKKNLAFKAISIKAPQKEAYIFADQYIEDFSSELAKTIKTEYPKELKELAIDDIQNIIKYNMYYKINNFE